MEGNDKYKLTLKYPAAWWRNRWREALPAGNGKIGAAVYGGIYSETILLNHEELWYGGVSDTLPDIRDTLAEVRKLMLEKKYIEANNMSCDKLQEKGYKSKVAAVLPFADIKIQMPVKNGFADYNRFVCMDTGEVGVHWKDGETSYQRDLFVSRADDMIVYEIRTDGNPIHADFTMCMHDMKESGQLFDDQELLKSVEVRAKNGYVYYSVTNDDGTDFGAVMKVVPSGGSMEDAGECVSVKNAANILVITKLFVKGSREKDWRRLQQELDDAKPDYLNLLKAHAPIHGELFHSASISLYDGEDIRSNEELLMDAYKGEMSNSLAEKMWAYGRYLFISATHKDSLPCALYGLWCGDYNPWWSQHVANENVEMIHWHASVGGLSELMLSLFNYYDGMMDVFRENAQKLFNCRGIHIPCYTSPGIGTPCVLVPVIVNWTGAAGWLARHYYDYYLYTGDREFLKNRALPFMKEAALFYEDFLVEGDNGEFLIFPSVSPENSPAGFHNNNFGLTHPMPTTINATMEIAIIRELFTNLIHAVHIIGDDVYEEDLKRWLNILQKVPSYEVNEDGAVKEWLHSDFPDNYKHRHLPHIYPVFPGKEICKENNPQLYQAFSKAVEKRLAIGISDQSGWSLAHLACTYARMGEGDSALECLELLSRSCLLNSFLTTHNDWRGMGIALIEPQAPVQIDANMGWVNAVQEMLLQVSLETVKILPALPTKWEKGSVRNLRFYTGKASFAWDVASKLFEAEICADRDTKVTLKLPDLFSNYNIKGGNTVPIKSDCYSILLCAGEVLQISSGDKAIRIA